MNEAAKRMGDLSAQLVRQGGEMRAKVWQVLTPEQRNTLEARRAERRERMEERRGRMGEMGGGAGERRGGMGERGGSREGGRPRRQ